MEFRLRRLAASAAKPSARLPKPMLPPPPPPLFEGGGGGGGATGPVDTTIATAEPATTLVPDAGFWLITLPDGTVALDDCVTAPSASPALVIAVVAAA